MRLNETFEIKQKVYQTKSGKSPLIIYVDPKTSTDNCFDARKTFETYGMVYLPSKLGNYAPHAYGWILWDGEQDKQMAYVKKFMNDLPQLEKNEQEGGKKRSSEEISSGLEATVQEILKSIEEAEVSNVKAQLDPETTKQIDDFKKMISTGIDSEETLNFIKQLINYNSTLKKISGRRLSWMNTLIIYFTTRGKATLVLPTQKWAMMGYQPKPNATRIVLTGMGNRYTKFNNREKAIVTQKFLEDYGVESVEELPESAKYDLKSKLRGHPIEGSSYLFSYVAYDKADVEPIQGKKTEEIPERPENWWNNAQEDEKDQLLTNALIKFVTSREGGSLTVNTENTQDSLEGARGNATISGVINLVGLEDEHVKFPTLVHETLHSLRHWAFASENNPSLKRFYDRSVDRDVREQEAELCTCFLLSVANTKWGTNYDMQPHLNYLKSWHLTKDTAGAVFDKIAEVANFIEGGIDKNLAKAPQETNNNVNTGE